MIERFFVQLARSIESASSLKQGDAFLPEYLKGKRLSEEAFPPVVGRLRDALGMTLGEQKPNEFPAAYECGHRQVVDYVFYTDGTPHVFLELETLDRAQLSTFADPPVNPEANSLNKLWYYYVTLGERHRQARPGPRFFAFLLVLPDDPVGHYQIWDSQKDYGFFDPCLEPLIRESPFRFYDPLIKASARRFLREVQEFPDPPALESWSWKVPGDLHELSELVFFTVTRSELVMSRGRDRFSPVAEVRELLRWHGT